MKVGELKTVLRVITKLHAGSEGAEKAKALNALAEALPVKDTAKLVDVVQTAQQRWPRGGPEQ